MTANQARTVGLEGSERSEEERAYYALNRRVYPKLAPFYDLVVWPIARVRRRVVRMVGADSSSRVLDVATGTGKQARAFAAVAREVIGIDISEPMLRVARHKNHRPNLSFHEADATDLPFGSGEFDIACISFALHEMPQSVRARVLREIARVTRPGGRIVAVDYALPRNRVAGAMVFHLVKLYERDHYAEFVQSDLATMVTGAGIAVRDLRRALLGAAHIVIGETG